MKSPRRLSPAHFLLLLLAVLLLPSLALAENTVITAMALSFDPAAPASAYTSVHVLSYEPGDFFSFGSMTLELIVPERFAANDVLGLKPGDAVYTQGQEVPVYSVTIEDYDESYGPMVYINAEPDDPESESLWMIPDPDGNYCHLRYEETVMNTFGPVTVRVSPGLLFLDSLDPSADEEHPAVLNADEFLNVYNQSDPASDTGFMSPFVHAVFNPSGTLILLLRGW